jgi:hypothetical protein
MIDKTKNAVREEERKKELMQKFEEIFGFKPDLLIWIDDFTLKASKRVSSDELSDDEEIGPTVEGKLVLEVSFRLLEEETDVGYDIDWKFSKSKGLAVNCYTWTKRLGQYTALVEVITKN